MHVQDPTPGWLDAAMALPDHSLVKSVNNGGTLREAKLRWMALGRDPKKLTTLYRHFGLEPAPPGSTWEQALAWWRLNFAKFIDGTWLSQYAEHVDLVEDCNEYTAVSTWVDDPDEGASKLLSMQAAAAVWNNQYRGRWFTSADGGHGFIPAACRFTLMCGPVANWWPRRVYEISRDYDAPINYHAYAQCLQGERVAGDFHDASGLFNNLESHYGIYDVDYVFGEVGPYKSSAEGWRASGCLNGDAGKLVEVARAVQRDGQKTRAFQEGRILGRNSWGAWFTIGGRDQWALYELEAPQLQALAKMYREESQEEDDDMDDQQKRAYINGRLNTIEQASAEIRAKVNEAAPLYEAIALGDLVLRDTSGNPAHTDDRTLAKPGNPGDVVVKGTHVKVYKDGQTAGVYRSRAWVTPEGLNVATVSGGQPMLQKL